eukprot:TRINITY_DN11019_c0_g2_i2.p1 TRINITY_DN11019_c0_g2~~TRINITY_DN11019_c0_g2_i2.p1  ORF type:complete len:313 (-),score=64.86 TRINITY_DN11019_c0_g2_i2:135-1073(-)
MPSDEQTSGTKLATFVVSEGQQSVGLVNGNHLWPLSSCLLPPSGPTADDLAGKLDNMVDVIKLWPVLKERISGPPAGAGLPLDSIRLLAPIPRPNGGVLCIGKNYKDHVKEVDTWKTAENITAPSIPQHPIIFVKGPQSVIGTGDVIRYPVGLSTMVDYEAELGVVIGKKAKAVPKETAMDYVFGYTVINDVTARDLQKKHQQWFIGKSCDTFCPMGPWIVPASEINGQDLQIRCWVDGELRQNGRTSDMIFNIAELIAVISEAVTLCPGDVIATGTPAGVGSGFKPPKHLLPGQTVRIQVEGIGELVNKVA